MTDREMTLEEWCAKLPEHHAVNRQLKALQAETAALKAVGYPVCKTHSIRDYTENRPDCPFCLQSRLDAVLTFRDVAGICGEMLKNNPWPSSDPRWKFVQDKMDEFLRLTMNWNRPEGEPQ